MGRSHPDACRFGRADEGPGVEAGSASCKARPGVRGNILAEAQPSRFPLSIVGGYVALVCVAGWWGVAAAALYVVVMLAAARDSFRQ